MLYEKLSGIKKKGLLYQQESFFYHNGQFFTERCAHNYRLLCAVTGKA